MNKLGINASSVNPYVYEEQEKKRQEKIESQQKPAHPEPMTLNFFSSSPDQHHKQKITVQNITIMSQNVNLGEISTQPH